MCGRVHDQVGTGGILRSSRGGRDSATPSAAHYQNVSATATQILPGSVKDIVMSDVDILLRFDYSVKQTELLFLQQLPSICLK